MKNREPQEYVIQPKGWRKRYKCHKNKGAHTFEIVYAEQANWFLVKSDGSRIPENHLLIHHECTACGKKHLEVVARKGTC